MHEITDDIRYIIEQARVVRNINKILSPRSKDPKIVDTINTIKRFTSFLPETADIRQRLWFIEHQTTTPPLCSNCGSSTVQWDYTNQKFREFCSPTCVGNNVDIQARKRKTCITNNGVEYPSQSAVIREKYKSTMINRYGMPYVNQTRLQINGTYDILTHDTLNNLTHDQQLSTFEIANIANVGQSTISKYMKHLGVPPRPTTSSSFQREVVDCIRHFCTSEIMINNRSIIKPQELDIVIPDLKLAIECDGLFWHSEVHGNKSRNYHLEKTTTANMAGYRLIHIFESDWNNHQAAVISRLQSLFSKNVTIHARKCFITQVPVNIARNFFDRNHIQGYVGSSILYGLEYDGQLVACMGFAKPRYNNHHEYELTRFCTLGGYTVVGGASKLLKQFIVQHTPQSIVSYCDKRWGTGGVYQHMGFTHLYDTPPNYWYISNGKIYSRVKYQKHKLSKMLPLFNPNLSEWENMKLNGYDRIWDCGNGVWSLKLCTFER